MKTGNYRLAIDMGTNSIGWAVLRLDDAKVCGLIDGGARIFSDSRNPKDGASLASMRREARQMRRQRDRALRRRDSLVKCLKRHGLMPTNDADFQRLLDMVDPYEARTKGVNEQIPLHELGRALFHLEKRRGFKSSRKAVADAKEQGVVHASIQATKEAMAAAGVETVGAFLQHRRATGETVRARRAGSKSNDPYTLYFDRALAEAEFDALWEKQAEFYPQVLTDDARDRLRHVMFYQRPLKPVLPGKCWLEPDERRARRALPSTQRFRIYQELANLEVIDANLQSRSLTPAERDLAAAELERKAKVTFKGLRRLLKLSANETFNLESEKRDFLVGNETAAVMGHKKRMDTAWFALDEARQDELVEAVCAAESNAALAHQLREEFGLSPEVADAVCAAPLAEGFGRVSLKAIGNILPHLRAAVMTYDKACLAAGYRHSDRYSGEIHEQLPYYGQVLVTHTNGGSGDLTDSVEVQYGRIPNPTVHVALNQLRKVVNAIIEVHGHPAEIILELARELKMSAKAKADRDREQTTQKKRNDGYREILAELGQRDTYDNRLRLRLWEELNPKDALDRRCPFTGQQISRAALFGNLVEVEHLLPFTRSLDDSPANKTLCMSRANRLKHNNSPYEAFGSSPKPYNWEDIAARALLLPPNKRWRFAPDAMDRIAGEKRDFLARQLTDTAYMSKVAREYLTAICNKDHVWVTPGRLTSLLRHHWGLNTLLGDGEEKDRGDHRHHAVDALVIGCTDRATLQSVARASAQGVTDRAVGRTPEPWPGFRLACEDRIKRIVVSHKPEHSTAGALHDETAYGLVELPEKGPATVVRRVNIHTLTKPQIENIRDPHERATLKSYLESRPLEKPADMLKAYAAMTGIRALRIEEKESVVLVTDSTGKAYKAYKPNGNYCLEIYADDAGKWRSDLIRVFDANTPAYQRFMADTKTFQQQTFSGHPLVMRLRKSDYVAIGHGANRRILSIVQVSAARVLWAEPTANSANAPPEQLPQRPGLTFLRANAARRVFVSILGCVKDPHAADHP